MNITLTIEKYLKTEGAIAACKELEAMVASPSYRTESSYSPTSEERVAFVDKHVRYLSTHQKINPDQYLSNLKLMTKIR